MASRKGKRQAKRNNLKIKSKLFPRKRVSKTMKNSKTTEKPLETLKWMNKSIADANSLKQNDAVPKWLNSCVYKQSRARPCSSSDNDTEYTENPDDEMEEKSSSSDVSDECNCAHPNGKYAEVAKGGILKHKISSTNSMVAKYIKSGMDHVASFIVESAIRFGEEHGVVIPDKNTPNVYEIMPPNRPFSDKNNKKIRFKIPDNSLGYEEAKKVMWRSREKDGEQGGSRLVEDIDSHQLYESKSSSWSSKTDSLEEILPLLEKLKKEGEIVTSDLDLEKFRKSSKDEEEHKSWKRNRVRDRYRVLNKRFKSVDDVSKASDELDYDPPKKNIWKKFKRDSLELGRQRFRAATCPRQAENLSPARY